MDFGTIALIIFICLEVLAEVFNAIDKRTGLGRKIKWIFRIVSWIFLVIVIILYFS